MVAQNSVDEVVSWLDRQGSTHFGASAKVYRAALLRFVERRVDREPNSVEWVMQNLDTLAQRLAKAEDVAPASLKTYLSRARSALTAYEDWAANPVGWAPKKNGGAASAKKDKTPKAIPKAKAPDSTVMRVPPPKAESERTLQDEISEALVAIANWPKLRPFLMKGLTEAMTGSTK
jgi:hypothetical protein